jgi:hypothetical protein
MSKVIHINLWSSLRVTNAVKKPMSTKKKASVARQDSFLKKFSTRQHYRTDSEESLEFEEESPGVVFVHNNITVFKPNGSLMFYWLLVVTIAVLYNIAFMMNTSIFGFIKMRFCL